MYLIDDLPYTSFDEDCDGLTDNLTPVVGVEGWTSLPSNDYKATMNAVAKVCNSASIVTFYALSLSFLDVSSFLSRW